LQQPQRRWRRAENDGAGDAADRDDEAYEWEKGSYATLSVEDAIDNADSYSFFAEEAFRP
jgi:hypothetical protein